MDHSRSTADADSHSDSQSDSGPSTLSVISDSESLTELSQQPPFKLIRSDGQLAGKDIHVYRDFDFPIPLSVKKCNNEKQSPPQSDVNQLIRDSVACLQALCGTDKVSRSDIETAAKKICDTLPVFRDPTPSFIGAAGKEFPYWVRHFLRTPHTFRCLV